MDDLGKDFADRAMARYKGGKPASKPETDEDEDDAASDKPESDDKRDVELGRAFSAAYRKGDYAAITAAIRAICA